MPLFDKTINTLSKSLDMQLMRHTVISENIANAETPYFKARRVNFESELQKAVENLDVTSDGRELASVSPEIYQEPNSEMGQDLNTVDMDKEMAMLTKNDLKYSASSQAISKKFALLKYAIGEGDR